MDLGELTTWKIFEAFVRREDLSVIQIFRHTRRAKYKHNTYKHVIDSWSCLKSLLLLKEEKRFEVRPQGPRGKGPESSKLSLRAPTIHHTCH